MTLLVRDEEDILSANLDYHFEQGVDFVVVTDNLSEDATGDILADYAREGLVHVIRETDDDYRQTVWVTRMARMAHNAFGADWVINSDADEFWWPEEGDLKAVLSSVDPRVGAIEVRRSNFPPCRDESGWFFDRMVVRDRQSVNSLGRPLPPKSCHRGVPAIEVAQGNRRLAGVPGVTAAEVPMSILHFPLRTYRQFERKIQNGSSVSQRRRGDPLDVPTWRMLHQEYLAGRLADYYAAEIVEADEVAKEPPDGRRVVDQRLRRFMGRRGLPRPRPSG